MADAATFDAKTFFIRYRPFLAVVGAVILLIAFLPGPDGSSGEVDNVAAGGGPDADRGGFGDTGGPEFGGTFDTVVGGGPATGVPNSGGAAGTPQGRSGIGSSVGGPNGSTGQGATNLPSGPPPVPAGASPDCDTTTGRIRVPSLGAPPCQPAFSGSNGGDTSQGVSDNEIVVVYFQAQSNAAADAALTGAGAQNQPPEQQATVEDYIDYFNDHYELFGRRVKLITRQGSGDPADDAVARQDALAIANDDKAFAVIGAPTSNAFPANLAAEGVICVCTVSQPQEFYESLDPYVGYTTLMASTQGYIQRAEYVGKRLAGRKAVHAGTRDALPQNTKTRKFGLLWYETPDGAYKAGVDFFIKEMKQRYGVTVNPSLSYTGFPDVAATQEQARPLIQKLKSEEVTSVIFSGDPIAPAIFTQEASRQLWFPEWIITGSALTDTSLFARTYDPTQWSNAFGVSFLTARSPAEAGDAFRVHMWHHGRPPTADNQYAILYAPIFTLMTGLTLAGPNLTAQSFQKGLFSYPITGRGNVTTPTTSFGNHGIWPRTDYTQYDDVTEIWWDPTANGEDEVGNVGAGLYRYVDGGKRYLPGEHPTTDPKVFVEAGSVTIYEEPPPNEVPPTYPHKH